MSLFGALTGEGHSDDYLTQYTKDRLKQEAAKNKQANAARQAAPLGRTRGGGSAAGREAQVALQDEYENQ